MNIIDQLDATTVTRRRGRGNVPKRFWGSSVSSFAERDNNFDVILARRVYNRYTKLKSLLIHEEILGRLIEMHGETRGRRTYGVRQEQSKIFPF